MPQALVFALCGGVATAAAGTAAWFLWRSRRTPAERERLRRVLIGTRGRLIEGEVLDFANGVVYYSYSWRGVEYEASQDLSAIAGGLPAEPDLLIGPATIKFLPGDASNSIVFSETWSGFPRLRSAVPTPRS